jgi:hypothetical protein
MSFSPIIRVKFNKRAIYEYYVADPESDMQDFYYRCLNYFDSQENMPLNWTMTGTYDEIEAIIYDRIWYPFPYGDFVLRRLLNSNLAILK